MCLSLGNSCIYFDLGIFIKVGKLGYGKKENAHCPNYEPSTGVSVPTLLVLQILVFSNISSTYVIFTNT